MSRPLRYECDGAFYHVVNLGNRRGRVFVSHRDYEVFLEKLTDSVELFDVRVFAYCLMPNHFHLYLSTRQANLSKFMQRLLTSFCVAYNKRHRSSGHVFQGRFKSHEVEDERYGAELSRYIHLNPVRTQKFVEAPMAERMDSLQDFKWSSYACLIGEADAPSWLDLPHTLDRWGGVNPGGMKRYRSYVIDGLRKGSPNPFDAMVEQMFLGSDDFVEKARIGTLLSQKPDEREVGSYSRLRGLFEFDQVAHAASKILGVKLGLLLGRRSIHAEERALLMYCACRFCSGRESITDLARRFSVSVGGMTIARSRVLRRMKTCQRTQEVVEQIERALFGSS